MDALAALIYKQGPGCVMFKRDLKRAYRQIRVCPGDIRKLGYVWRGKTYLDKVVSMGLRSGAYIHYRQKWLLHLVILMKIQFTSIELKFSCIIIVLLI